MLLDCFSRTLDYLVIVVLLMPWLLLLVEWGWWSGCLLNLLLKLQILILTLDHRVWLAFEIMENLLIEDIAIIFNQVLRSLPIIHQGIRIPHSPFPLEVLFYWINEIRWSQYIKSAHVIELRYSSDWRTHKGIIVGGFHILWWVNRRT